MIPAQGLRAAAAIGVAAIVLFAPLGPRESCGEEERDPGEWQARADRARWEFEDDETDPFFCATRRNDQFGAYEITLRVQKGARAVGIDVLEEGVVRHSWMGHLHSVFAIRDKKLYYADFGPNSTGAWVVAVDLATGQRLWRERCRGIGSVHHSGYRNRINLHVVRDVVVVHGLESLGRYIEFKSVAEGKTVGHKIFDRESR